MWQAGKALFAERRFDQWAHAIFVVQDNVSLELHQVKRLAQIGKHHHAELESFALVNAHQPDCAFRLGGRRTIIHIELFLRLEKTEEAKEALALKLVKLPCPCQEPCEVALPLRRAGLSQQVGFIVRIAQNAIEARG